MFTIVSLMREEPAVMCRHIDYHLKLGAQKILIFYDGEEGEEFRGLLAEKFPPERILYTVLRPSDYPVESEEDDAKSFRTKQRYIHKRAQEISETEWILTLDADEFLLSVDKLPTLIKSVPADVLSFTVPVAEAVWGPDDKFGSAFGSTYFRVPFRAPYRGWTRQGFASLIRRLLAGATYLRDGWLFHNNVAGHEVGRHFFRKSADFDWIGPHSARIDGQRATVKSRKLFGKDATMLVAHFDAISFDRWVEKLRRRVAKEVLNVRERSQRHYQLSEFEKAYLVFTETGDERALHALMKRLYALNSFQFRFLKLFGCAFRADIFGQNKD